MLDVKNTYAIKMEVNIYNLFIYNLFIYNLFIYNLFIYNNKN